MKIVLTKLFFFLNFLFSQYELKDLTKVRYPDDLKTNKYSFSKIEINNFNDIYLIDSFSSKIISFNKKNNKLFFSKGLSYSTQINASFTDITSSLGLEVFVTDYDNHKIHYFDKKLNFINSINLYDFEIPIEFPTYIQRNSYGYLWVVSENLFSLNQININGEFINKIEGARFNSFSGIKGFDLNKKNQIGLIDNNNIFFHFSENGKLIWEKKIDFNLITVNAFENGWVLFTDKNNFFYIDMDHFALIKKNENSQLEILDFKIKNNEIYFLTKNNLILNAKIDINFN